MLFIAEYKLTWESLDAVIAKRLEWEEIQPEGFRFVGEYVWQDGATPFRGIAIIEADTVGALNSFVLHYGPTLQMSFHPASDVASSIQQVRGGTKTRGARRRGSKR
mgnify:CR=1 FL=1